MSESDYVPLPDGRPELYPQTVEEHARLSGQMQEYFRAADDKRKPKEDRWRRLIRLSRSYQTATGAPAWRSAAFIPYAFSTIEAIVPRMVAELPTFVCRPFGPEDQLPAMAMEHKLRHSAEVTDLHMQLILAIKASLRLGTGILKNYYMQDIRTAYEQVPVMQEVPGEVFENPTGEVDMAGQPITEQVQSPPTQAPVLGPDGQPQMEMRPYEYQVYAGPCASWVDVFDFWPAPDARTIEDARYVIHRTRKTAEEVQELLAQGIYQLPPGVTELAELWNEEEDGTEIREDELGEGGINDVTTNEVELLEFWTKDNRVITLANRSWILRVQSNPFDHGEKPFVRFVDYLNEGEFWGTGEVEAIEQLQDLANAIINQRIDTTRLSMDAMFAVNTKAIEDERDLLMRPGGVIRVTGDYLPQEAIQRIDLGDVNPSAFQEAQEIEKLIERVSGVSGFQLGQTEDSMTRTATGISLITEAGNSKFALKVKLMEQMALRPLARQWGAIIQQYAEEDEAIRMMGPQGQWLFVNLDPASIQGAIDYTIETSSTTQDETVRKEQAITLLQSLSGVFPNAVPQLVKDVLDAFGKQNLIPYFMGQPDITWQLQMMQAQASGGNILPMPMDAAATLGTSPEPQEPEVDQEEAAQ